MLLKKFNFEINTNINCFIKDFEIKKFNSRFPELNKLISEMLNCLNPGYKNYLVDFIVKDYNKGEKTCKDIRYHVDGDFDKDNQYCIWLCGENRTIFSKETIDFTKFPQDRNEQSNLLEQILRDKECFEIPEKNILVYNSLTAHKGVACRNSGRRVLVRLMGTNYIKPKNKVIIDI